MYLRCGLGYTMQVLPSQTVPAAPNASGQLSLPVSLLFHLPIHASFPDTPSGRLALSVTVLTSLVAITKWKGYERWSRILAATPAIATVDQSHRPQG